MAHINPISSSMRLLMSVGQQGGKEITKSQSIPNLDVGADAGSLHNAAEAIATLLEHQVTSVRHSALGVIVE